MARRLFGFSAMDTKPIIAGAIQMASAIPVTGSFTRCSPRTTSHANGVAEN